MASVIGTTIDDVRGVVGNQHSRMITDVQTKVERDGDEIRLRQRASHKAASDTIVISKFTEQEAAAIRDAIDELLDGSG